METQLKLLEAYHGDCILIKTFDCSGNDFIILIDGGTASTFDYSLKNELKQISKIDLLILTHIDSDHIAGLIRFFKNSLFAKIKVGSFWINGANLAKTPSGEKISYNQGKSIEQLLIDNKVARSSIFSLVTNEFSPSLPEGIEIEILSPTTSILNSLYAQWPIISKELNASDVKVKASTGTASQISKGALVDLAKEEFKPSKNIENDLFNSSSIAFILRTPDKSILMLGDARSEVLVNSLNDKGYTKDNKLLVDFVKVSHHGSINNTSCELLDIINCDKFGISTNGGNASHKHPDRETIARIVHHPERDYEVERLIFFNYPVDDIQKKCGQLINSSDLSIGNWSYFDSITEVPL
ncbi:MBL fold metallo-hydrolase [Pontibacter sp. BT731]|uniref:ComEC/Rec2 family competence protein n=1 Tax=Pontibacter coccineus TaxID=3063328 RepID=UPI0026E176B7|nr:MBL fold metallo-hydrolase [Pontibacter sp. BT731]MDO6388689.1 MBL fold metallo-hydrolase [Pontibacter sp. BT731]